MKYGKKKASPMVSVTFIAFYLINPSRVIGVGSSIAPKAVRDSSRTSEAAIALNEGNVNYQLGKTFHVCHNVSKPLGYSHVEPDFDKEILVCSSVNFSSFSVFTVSATRDGYINHWLIPLSSRSNGEQCHLAHRCRH
jgi:hypothetical protein